MRAFLYGVVLQWKLDIRSNTSLVTCYLVPLLFFAIMGGIFTSIVPTMKNTLIQTMTVMGVSMGAIIGLPPTILETYGSDIKKVYRANGVPLYLGVATMFISTFINLMIMSILIFLIAPIVFDAILPTNIPFYFLGLAILIIISLSIAIVLGLLVKKQAKLTMFSQIIFLPSIMLSGIMFPVNLLPKPLEIIGKVFPATWGYRLMLNSEFQIENLLVLIIVFIIAILSIIFLLKKQVQE
ncbi:ABC transporter permease [Oceanotoga sp. DSM 15011]|uniref:ABC transporter permease n=1 Tax=Oceanotoga sp. DSM 15011 TaxID=2984951 RepID=UPI0021F457F6|nr:ABC transporter permease [Oceanotoga sp. DSM 15011]UYP00349.1 ABC transporter permease [Oceanotoga sp. DSM 15011]